MIANQLLSLPMAYTSTSFSSSFCVTTLLISSIKGTHLSRLFTFHVPPVTSMLCTSSISPPSPPNMKSRALPISCPRRVVMVEIALAYVATVLNGSAQARGRRNRMDIPLENYKTSPDGLKFYDTIEGKGPLAQKGQRVLVHFDCIYRGINAVSSRESKLLAGNRVIAQPYELIVGSIPGKERKREFVENANGLFSAQAAPKPPPALYSLTEGMRVGGKRTVIVTAEAGYGNKGVNEIPPGATFQMDIEMLEVKKDASAS